MTDLLTTAGFVLAVSGVLVGRHVRRWWARGAGSLMFIGGLALMLAAIATIGGAQ